MTPILRRAIYDARKSTRGGGYCWSGEWFTSGISFDASKPIPPPRPVTQVEFIGPNLYLIWHGQRFNIDTQKKKVANGQHSKILARVGRVSLQQVASVTNVPSAPGPDKASA